jgi:hypothetical protein
MGVHQVSLTGLAHTPRLDPAFWPSIPVKGLSWARELTLCEFCCHQGPSRDYRPLDPVHRIRNVSMTSHQQTCYTFVIITVVLFTYMPDIITS